MAETEIPEGIYTPVPTFYKDIDFSLDIETQIQHAKQLYSSGIHGLVVSGSMGESSHLTREERITLVRKIREAIPDPKFKIIAGIPQLNIKDTILDIQGAHTAKADYSIILTPGYFGLNLTSQQGIVDYFFAIADKSPLPIIIYNYPAVCNGVDLSVDTFEKLSCHPKIVGVKLTHFNLDKYTMLAGNKRLNEANNFKVFTGLGQVLVPSLCVGLSGAIDGLSGIFPKCMLRIFNLHKQGNFQEAAELQVLVAKADQMIMDLNLVGVKYALKTVHGLGSTICGRLPLNVPITEEKWKKYESSINALVDVEKKLE